LRNPGLYLATPAGITDPGYSCVTLFVYSCLLAEADFEATNASSASTYD
jgi:hypothetical protein